MNKPSRFIIIALIGILLTGFCLLTALLAFGSGLTVWLALGQPSPTATPTRKLAVLPSLTPTVTPTLPPTTTATPTLTPSPTASLTTAPTNTSSPTLVPATNTPVPTPAPPTATPLPTDTPTPAPPAFPFVIQETETHETNHLNFDVYVAVTNAQNKPIPGYRVVGRHSSGLTAESQMSTADWTVNSGARQYKAGNIKFEAFNSPTGLWTLQLVNEAGQPVALPIDFLFDPASPTWHFVLYRQNDG